MSYQYDLFVSYSSDDRPWALKLYDDLKARNIKVFLDQNRLDIGKPWEPQLAKAVQGSQHLVVLWSGNADRSQWVRREVSYFENLNDPNLFTQKGDSRRYIFLLLEGENRAYAGAQGIGLLKDAGAYQPTAADKGAGAVNAGEWQDVVSKLDHAIRDDDPSIPVPLAILSMTLSDLQRIDPMEVLDVGYPSLNSLLQNIGIGSRDDLLQYYGAGRNDWRPFQDTRNIGQIFDSLLVDLNNGIQDPKFRFRWDPISNDFWTDINVARAARDKLLSRPSVIVIDPLSLYDDRVFNRLVALSECFKSDRSIIMVLTPFSMPRAIIDLGTLVRNRATPYFDRYWDPPVPFVSRSATLGVNLGYEGDLRRLLRESLGEYVQQAQPQSGAPFLRQ